MQALRERRRTRLQSRRQAVLRIGTPAPWISACMIAWTPVDGQPGRGIIYVALGPPACSNVCCFSVTAPLREEEPDELLESIAQALYIHGRAIFSTTRHAGRVVLRAAIANQRTTDSDIHYSIAAVEDVRKSLVGKNVNIDIA